MGTPDLANPELGSSAVLVTGASRGIGAAVARLVADRGARVVLSARSRADLESVAADLPGDPVVIPADLAAPDEAARLAAAAVAAVGTIAGLVNNAGLLIRAPLDEFTAPEVDRLLAVNVRSSLLLAGAVARHMAGAGGGSIVNLSSVLGRVGTPNVVAYAATKAAVAGVSRAMAAEYGGRQVRVNTVSPGIVDTDMGANVVQNSLALESYIGQTPLGRVAATEDVANAIGFLLGPSARYVTGQEIVVDGGWSSTRVAAVR